MVDKVFGENVRALRQEMGMTMKDLAMYCEVSLKTIYNWELKGKVPRHTETIKRLEKRFGVDFTTLFIKVQRTSTSYELSLANLKKLRAYHEKCIEDIDKLLASLE